MVLLFEKDNQRHFCCLKCFQRNMKDSPLYERNMVQAVKRTYDQADVAEEPEPYDY